MTTHNTHNNDRQEPDLGKTDQKLNIQLSNGFLIERHMVKRLITLQNLNIG